MIRSGRKLAFREARGVAAKISNIPPMPLLDFLSPEAIVPALKAHSKKQALHDLAAQAASRVGRDEREIFETLLQR